MKDKISLNQKKIMKKIFRILIKINIQIKIKSKIIVAGIDKINKKLLMTMIP